MSAAMPVRQRRVSRATPRNSDAEAMGEASTAETPYANLRQLAGIMQKSSTPGEENLELGPSSGQTQRHRTPSVAGAASRGRSARHPVSLKRGTPTTPHTIRALQRRKAAALTPGRTRRQSGRMQRETPRETLRQLSKLLAKDSRPVAPSPGVEDPQSAGLGALDEENVPEDDNLDDEPDLPAPRLSLPLEEEDEGDSSLQAPPEDVALHVEEENLTQRSVEMARRAFNDPSGRRNTRVSFGSIRFSDRFADVEALKDRETSEGEEDIARMESDERDQEEMDREEQEDDDMMLNDDDTTPIQERAPSEAATEGRGDTGIFPLHEDLDEPTFTLPMPQPAQEVVSSPDPQLMEQDEPENQPTEPTVVEKAPRPRPARTLRLSRHGIPYPSLPAGVVKRLATTVAPNSRRGKPPISKETLGALVEASDCFFEQVSDDLGAYAQHAGRHTIDERDMITLMKRQRQINATSTTFSLAQRWLPRELVQDIRMDHVKRPRRMRKPRLATIQEEDEAS